MSRPWERAIDEHVGLIRWLGTSEGARLMRSIADDEAPDPIAALNRSETFWVSFDMYKLTRHAAEKIHGKTLMDTVPPAEDGFVLFDRPQGMSREENQAWLEADKAATDFLGRVAAATEVRFTFQALSWHFLPPKGVFVRCYAYMQLDRDLELYPRDGGPLLRLGGRDGSTLRMAFPIAGDGGPRRLLPTGAIGKFPVDQALESDLYRFLVAFWLLIDQRIVRQAKNPVDRHVRRRATRANLNFEDGLKVITLRREEPRPRTAAVDQPIEVQWSHRWIVSKHERNQWYPTLGMHLPITIEAYEKGPEGAPLVIKDRIFKVDR